MAIVKNSADLGQPIDNKLCQPNRTNAGSPSSALTPLYAGEIVEDTTNAQLYVATGTSANTDWMLVLETNRH